MGETKGKKEEREEQRGGGRRRGSLEEWRGLYVPARKRRRQSDGGTLIGLVHIERGTAHYCTVHPYPITLWCVFIYLLHFYDVFIIFDIFKVLLIGIGYANRIP